MSPYYKYKKEKFLDKYKNANQTLEDLKISLFRYRQDNVILSYNNSKNN